MRYIPLTVGQNTVLRIPIRIPNTDPDPEGSIEYRSGRIRIRNTDSNNTGIVLSQWSHPTPTAWENPLPAARVNLNLDPVIPFQIRFWIQPKGRNLSGDPQQWLKCRCFRIVASTSICFLASCKACQG